MDNNAYCIWDPLRGKWWNPNSRGYSGNLSNAGTYSKEHAKRICDNPGVKEEMYLKSNLMQSESLRNKIYGIVRI